MCLGLQTLLSMVTLERYAALTVQEPAQHPDAELAELTADEREVFDGLRSGRWGAKVRLEHERITRPDALGTLPVVVEQAGRQRL